MTIRTKLVTVFLAIGLIPALALALQGWQSTTTIAEGQGSQFEQMAASMIDTIERNLFERYGDVQAFGFNQIVQQRQHWYRPTADNPIVQDMNRYVQTYGIYYLTLLVDTDGRVIAVNDRNAAGERVETGFLYATNFAGAGWFQDVLAGRFLSSDLLTGTVVEDLHVDPDVQRIYGDEGLTLGYAAPVRDRRGRVIAVWKNYAKWSLVEDIAVATYRTLTRTGLQTAELTVLDKAGRVLVDVDPRTHHVLVNRDMDRVVMKLNLVQNGVAQAKAAVGGATGHGRGFHARKQIWQVGGYAHSQGALGYPGLGWSVLVRVSEAEAHALIDQMRQFLVAVLLISAIAIVAAGVYFARSFAHPVNLMVSRLKNMAEGEGDLTKRIHLTRSDEFGEMGRWFDLFVEKIHTLVCEVAGASTQVTAAAQEIATTSSRVAQGMRRQADEVTQVSTAVEEMSATINEVARQSGEASGNAQEAGSQAKDGAQVVEVTVATIQSIADVVHQAAGAITELGTRSKEIGHVINVINDIADQTNLLALNAAIEAARAGDQGRGFAVVADEVRKLAERTAKATQEVSLTIKAIQRDTGSAVDRMHEGTGQVTEGVSHAERARIALETILLVFKDVATKVQAIATAAEEQSAATQEIARSVESINSVTRETASLTESSATAVRQLQEKAESLQSMIRRFKIEAGPPRTLPRPLEREPALAGAAGTRRGAGGRTPS